MIEVRIMIANGQETMTYRDQAMEVIKRVNHLFLHDLEADLTVTNWDFRNDAPTVVPAGSMAVRSLGMVDLSEVVLVIFGTKVPKITRKELLRAFERRKSGARVEVWTFVDPRTMQKPAELFEKIKQKFDEEVVWTPYRDKTDFQATMFTTMFKYLSERCGAKFPGRAA